MPNKASLGCKAIELSTKSLSDKLFGFPSRNGKALVKQSNISSKMNESDEKVAKRNRQQALNSIWMRAAYKYKMDEGEEI